MAGEAAADEVDRREAFRPDLADVFVAARFGEVAREDRSAIGVELDLPGDPHPRRFEAEVEAADTREERPDIHPSPLGSWPPRTLKSGR
ncbi:MAG TPA: hypothetical protein VGC63_07135 [Solirubrobacterales bacterium]